MLIATRIGFHLRRLVRAWRMPTASVARLFPRAPSDFHQLATDTFKQQKADAVTVGGLGLAAWSILAALKPGMAQMPTRLLFLGVLANLGGATIFRQGPSEKRVATRALDLNGCMHLG